MSVDLTDPNIAVCYEDIIKNKGKDWLILSYGHTRDKLTLFRSGDGDIDSMRENIPLELEDVYFGFCREREDEKNYYALIAYIPEGVSGVKRARALVHMRAVSSLFKAAQVTVNVSDRTAISSDKLRDRLQLSPSLIPRLASGNRIVQRSASEPAEKRSSSDSINTPVQSPRLKNFVSDYHDQVSTFKAADQASTIHMPLIPSIISDAPPPTPPKDWKSKPLPMPSDPGVSVTNSEDRDRQPASDTNPSQFVSRRRALSRSELAYISDGYGNDVEEAVINPDGSESLDKWRGRSQFAQPRPTPRFLSPEEKARIRLELHKQKEIEDQAARREETKRQLRLQKRKEEMLRQEQIEDDQRLARIEEEKQRALSERARRELQVQLEEESKLREIELRRQQEKQRRAEQARRIEAERLEAEKRAAEVVKRREEQRRLSEENKRIRMKEIQREFSRKSGDSVVLLAGNITVQTSTSISWKRRFFELKGDGLYFYRDSRDRTSPLDIMVTEGGRVGAIREPQEGYDELQAIPYSFAVEFTDGDGPWCMFADTAEDKDVFISLLSQSAGL